MLGVVAACPMLGVVVECWSMALMSTLSSNMCPWVSGYNACAQHPVVPATGIVHRFHAEGHLLWQAWMEFVTYVPVPHKHAGQTHMLAWRHPLLFKASGMYAA